MFLFREFNNLHFTKSLKVNEIPAEHETYYSTRPKPLTSSSPAMDINVS